MDTDHFIVYIQADDIYRDIKEEVETRYDILNHELDRPWPAIKNEKVIALMKY